MPAFHVRLIFFVVVLLLTKRKLQISIIPFENARVSRIFLSVVLTIILFDRNFFCVVARKLQISIIP